MMLTVVIVLAGVVVILAGIVAGVLLGDLAARCCRKS